MISVPFLSAGSSRYNYQGSSGYGTRASAPYPPPQGNDYDRYTASAPYPPPQGNDYDRYTAGLSEEEQIRRATDESLRQSKVHTWSGYFADLGSSCKTIFSIIVISDYNLMTSLQQKISPNSQR